MALVDLCIWRTALSFKTKFNEWVYNAWYMMVLCVELPVSDPTPTQNKELPLTWQRNTYKSRRALWIGGKTNQRPDLGSSACHWILAVDLWNTDTNTLGKESERAFLEIRKVGSVTLFHEEETERTKCCSGYGTRRKIILKYKT